MTYHHKHLYNVLLKYKTTVVEEARMQFFLMGNRKYSLYIIGTNMMAILFYPEHIRSFFREYQRGKKAIPIGKWKFEHLLNEPTERLQNIIHRQYNPAPPESLF